MDDQIQRLAAEINELRRQFKAEFEQLGSDLEAGPVDLFEHAQRWGRLGWWFTVCAKKLGELRQIAGAAQVPLDTPELKRPFELN